jgi:hypothetical protein
LPASSERREPTSPKRYLTSQLVLWGISIAV